MRPEARLQRECVLWVRQAHPEALCVNMHGSGWGAKGFPDLFLVVRGRFVAVELKAGTGWGLQPAQRMWAERIERAGGRWHLCSSLEEFKDAIEMEV